MKLRDLKEKLARLDDDAEVEDRFGDEITDITVTMDSRRRVRFETGADGYKELLEKAIDEVDDLRQALREARRSR